MNLKKSIILALFVALTAMVLTNLGSSEETPPAGPKNEAQSKITTPPLKLSEEIEKRGDGKGPVGIKVPEITPFAPTPLKAKAEIELILDASGSMNGLMGPTTKMAILKSVAHDVIREPLPEGVEREMALRVYGSQQPSEASDCKDTELLIPMGSLDKKEFEPKIDSMNALGVTPIGHALTEAAKDFKPATTDVDHVIILVTDGMDSCGADLCKIAETLHNDPKKIIINVIGFDLDKNAREALDCVSAKSDGQFLSARGEDELAASLDQAVMANVPYNLRLKILSGASPIPADLKVFRSGTKNVVREESTSGTKYYQLPPGTYDIEVTYSESLEKPPPVKLVKSVEVQATSKAEQVVQFDLGLLTLSALDDKGNPIAASYILRKTEDPKVLVNFKNDAGAKTLRLTEGTYNVKVKATTPEGLSLSGASPNLNLKKGESIAHEFKFQVGKLKLAGKNTKGESIPLNYKITPLGEETPTVLEGSTLLEGKTIDLPPGKYKLDVTLAVEGIKELPGVPMGEIELQGGDTIEKTAEIATGTLKLVGKDGEGKLTETLFSLKPNISKEAPAEFTFKNEPIILNLPPGRYDIKAVSTVSEFDPKPTVLWEALQLSKDQVLDKEAVFKFGALQLAGKNSKGAPVESSFSIYTLGEKEPIAIFSNILSPTTVKLTEGFYDIKAEDMTARSDPKPSLWFHNVEVRLDTPVTREAIFTYGKLKMICRGPNNVLLQCDYRVFNYGTDSPLFEGATEEIWREFDIPPGSYYIEAGYHDVEDEVLLKKWIAFKVGENEMVEKVLRF